jgi:hypothetical protein
MYCLTSLAPCQLLFASYRNANSSKATKMRIQCSQHVSTDFQVVLRRKHGDSVSFSPHDRTQTKFQAVVFRLLVMVHEALINDVVVTKRYARI